MRQSQMIAMLAAQQVMAGLEPRFVEDTSRHKSFAVHGNCYRAKKREHPKTGRNAKCHCGSGIKYKNCCYEKDATP